jgi:hypothetical protein
VTQISRRAVSAVVTAAALALGAVAAHATPAAHATAPGHGPARAARARVTSASPDQVVASGGWSGRPVLVRRGARPAQGTSSSFNSAGYVVSRTRTRFRFVQATFFVPYLNCRLSPSTSSLDWVGLDGFVGRPDSVEQDGIQADCDKAGKASYRAWYAMYPRPQRLSKITIRAGDSITANVYVDTADGTFLLSVTDNSTGGHFRVRLRCPRGTQCPRTSAEIISSAPDSGSGSHLVIRPLADYGAVSFGSVAVTDNVGQRGSLRSARWTATRIIETQRTSPFRLLARPTLTQGDTFDTYWAKAS